MAESLPLPFPEHWYPAMKCWVFKEIYLKLMAKSVGNSDMFIQYRNLKDTYERDYERMKIKKYIPLQVVKEGGIKL